MGATYPNGLYRASVSAELAQLFRGRLCQTLLQNRSPSIVQKGQIIYDVGDTDRTFFIIRRGLVKVGTITEDGHELIYDLRKDGEVVGELSALEAPRRDRVVALEQTELFAVPYAEVVAAVQKNAALLQDLLEAFGKSLSDALERINQLTVEDTTQRVVDVLLKLAAKFGRPCGKFTEIDVSLTQEEIAQMVGARRERVSTALNSLRQRGLVQYARRHHLLVAVKAVERYRA